MLCSMWLLTSAGVHVFAMFCFVPTLGTSLYSCACVLVLCDMCVRDRQRLNGTCFCVYVRVTCSHRFTRSHAYACRGLLALCRTADKLTGKVSTPSLGMLVLVTALRHQANSCVRQALRVVGLTDLAYSRGMLCVRSACALALFLFRTQAQSYA
jgi:hypothetical protein